MSSYFALKRIFLGDEQNRGLSIGELTVGPGVDAALPARGAAFCAGAGGAPDCRSSDELLSALPSLFPLMGATRFGEPASLSKSESDALWSKSFSISPILLISSAGFAIEALRVVPSNATLER